MTNEKAVAEKLLQINAIKLNLQQPYTWASGWKSPIYCDNRKLLSHPYQRDFIKSELCELIFQQYPNVDILAGVATAGIAWGAMAADQLKLPFVYVRPQPKAHGLGNQIEGDCKAGSTVLVIEDLISTGKSSLQVCEVLRNAGVTVVGMVCIVNYGFPQAAEAFAAANIPCHSLTNYNTILALAKSKNQLSEEAFKSLLNWQQNPAEWQP